MKFVRQLTDFVVPVSDLKMMNYAFLVWFMEENAGLTYKEARVVLRDIRGESVSDLAELFECTTQAIHNFDRKGTRKLIDAGILLPEET